MKNEKNLSFMSECIYENKFFRIPNKIIGRLPQLKSIVGHFIKSVKTPLPLLRI